MRKRLLQLWVGDEWCDMNPWYNLSHIHSPNCSHTTYEIASFPGKPVFQHIGLYWFLKQGIYWFSRYPSVCICFFSDFSTCNWVCYQQCGELFSESQQERYGKSWGLWMTNIGLMIDERMVYPQYIPCHLGGWTGFLIEWEEIDLTSSQRMSFSFRKHVRKNQKIMFQKDNCSIYILYIIWSSAVDAGCMIILCLFTVSSSSVSEMS